MIFHYQAGSKIILPYGDGMKSKATINRIIIEASQHHPEIHVEINEDGLLIRQLHDDDDTSYIVNIYEVKEKEIYRQGIVIYPWEEESMIRKKFLTTALEFQLRMRRI